MYPTLNLPHGASSGTIPYAPVSLDNGEVRRRKAAGFQAYCFRNNANATEYLQHAMLWTEKQVLSKCRNRMAMEHRAQQHANVYPSYYVKYN